MKKTVISIIIVILVVSIAIFAVGGLNNSHSSAESINDTDVFAQHLTADGFKVYGASGCSACTYQEELFGNSWQYINYVECAIEGGGQAEVCQEAEIMAYPTWEFPDGVKRAGALSLDELTEKSGFEINK